MSVTRPRYALILTLLFAGTCYSAAGQSTDFAELSLEELTHYDVTTLGRKNATVFDTPAPTDVVSGDEIHNSGATTLPEALRLSTGVQVSRVDSLNYAISIRGFDDATSSKLLVLMDGRTVYNQLDFGTNWGLMDMVMDDVNRIEVQRGPAASLWGTDAVNGVINIVSKNAHSTLGELVSIATGDQLDSAISVRDGFEITPAAAMRVYAKYQKQGDYGDYQGEAAGTSGVTGWNSRLAGTRFDWDRPGGGGLSVIAEYRELRTDSNTLLPTVIPPLYSIVVPEQERERAGDLTAHWTQPVTDDGTLSVLASFESGDLEEFLTGERHTTSNIDSQVTLHPVPHNEVIAGATFRTTSDHIHNTPYLIYDDPAETINTAGVFAQDEIAAIPEILNFTLGTKMERNSFVGWETQPSLRALWHPTRSQSIWLAVSSAARIPSRAERGVHYYAASLPPGAAYPLPVELFANGDPNFGAEHVLSYELGHRFEIGRVFSIETSLFYSRYTDLRGLRPMVSPPIFTQGPPYIVLDFDATNSLSGYTSGGEFSLHWRPQPTFDLKASVASLRTHLQEDSPGAIPDPSVFGLEGNSPHEEYKLNGTWHPAAGWTAVLLARETGALPESQVPAYTGLDARLAWTLSPNVELEVVGRDLLKREHTEIAGYFLSTVARPIARSFYFGLTYHH